MFENYKYGSFIDVLAFAVMAQFAANRRFIYFDVLTLPGDWAASCIQQMP
jgi:hypothetical protein